MENINSKEYWDNRFSTDWKEYSGNEQTKYFASILGEMLPEWLIHDVNENCYAVCDLGCAEGDALQIYKQFFMTSEISGEDFSETAIETAGRVYPEFGFKVSNILEPEKETKYPVIICSNVVEHFKETYKVISSICERSTKYTIVLIPYRETPGDISEHERVFHTKDIPLQVKENHLVYAKSVFCNSVYYPYEQLLLVYAKGEKFSLLSEITENISSDREKEIGDREKESADREKKTSEELAEKSNRLEEIIAEVADVNKKLNVYEQQIEEKCKQLSAWEQQIEEKNKQLSDYEWQIEEDQRQLRECNVLLEEHENSRLQCTNEIEALRQEVAGLQQEYAMAMAVLRQKDEYMAQAQELCNYFATGKLMGLNHFLFRVKGQLFKGNKADRKEFWTWLRGKIKRTNRTIGAGVTYNPWMVTREKLGEGIACRVIPVNREIEGKAYYTEPDPLTVTEEKTEISLLQQTQQILQKDYTKYDVIILSVIDYNFRHQRPQHFATRFADNEHRVFYVNANFVRPDTVVQESKNLYVVDFSCKEYNAIYGMEGRQTLTWMKEKFAALIDRYAIRDAVVIVDYPNWVYGAEYIREKYGFKLVTDYMDDYTGFLGTAEDFLKDNCVRLLKNSDLVVSSSQFLYDVACKYADPEKIEIVRNGTEVEHFYKAINLKTEGKERKTVGYYGAVAHWFAWDKVCYLAEHLPECDVVIVGDVTEYRDKLEKHDNIHLLGEKPYKDLPQYLADFDVCLIPFDTSTDLIKATNPVKFYEYLSAGKKVVATEIPELMEFKNQYVYMSNENEQFLEYVKLCLEGKDTLKSEADCISFAKENDWQKRYECFEKSCTKQIPKVSVIVLTYNNLELNKVCVNSILNETAYANYELIIVDNQSTDGTREYLRELEQKQIPNVKVVLNDSNLGFAGGNNQGMRIAEGDYVLLLNNDTAVTRGWLTAMVKHLENNPQFGMCNPVTNSIGNESMIKVNYTNIQEMREFAYAYTSLHAGDEYLDVDRQPLFATMIPRRVIEKVGMLDDSYKIGMFEDDDYTEAVKKAGYELVIAEDAFIHHVNNASFKKLSDEAYRKIFEENKAIFEKKWHKKWTTPKYRKGVTADSNIGMKI